MEPPRGQRTAAECLLPRGAGVRMWANNTLVLDRWYDQAGYSIGATFLLAGSGPGGPTAL